MDLKDVSKLAELARIELGEEEKKSMLRDMSGILDYVKIIERVTADDTPVEHKIYNVWREDKIDNREFSVPIITQQFPDSQDGFLKVKKIL
jgi:aspartyl-tRNA(Asn)/glutamyl-tRNA(Gln) amidotransferase subunit C